MSETDKIDIFIFNGKFKEYIFRWIFVNSLVKLVNYLGSSHSKNKLEFAKMLTWAVLSLLSPEK